jgi:hypothetical protein
MRWVLIINLASDVPARERFDFLRKLSAKTQKKVKFFDTADILNRISALAEQIRDRA